MRRQNRRLRGGILRAIRLDPDTGKVDDILHPLRQKFHVFIFC